MPHYWYEKVTPVSRFIPTFGASSVSQISSLEKKITKEKRCKSKKKRTLLQLSKVKWSACPLLLLIIWSLHWGKKVKHFDGTKVFFLCTLLSCTYIFFLHSLFYCQWDFIFYTKWVESELGEEVGLKLEKNWIPLLQDNSTMIIIKWPFLKNSFEYKTLYIRWIIFNFNEVSK